MLRKFIPYVLALALMSSPVHAQSEEEPKQEKKNQVTMELGGEAPWYNVRGPRVNFTFDTYAGEFSGAYVPASESYADVHDFHVAWLLPKKLTGGYEAKPIFGHSDANGIGGGIAITVPITNSTQIVGRNEVFVNGTSYGDIKLLSKHLDLDFGAKRDDKTHLYGYFTINDGRWDDTFTLGYGPDDIVWNNFSAQRKNIGVFSLNYWQPKSGDWTVDVYAAKDSLQRFWYERFIDRLVANNDVNPKERSHILALPSYLTFGRWCAELRADHTNNKTFVNAGLGRTFTRSDGKLKDSRFGVGSGIEYVNADESVWKPNAEVFLEMPLGPYVVTAHKRFRTEEGDWYLSVGRKF